MEEIFWYVGLPVRIAAALFISIIMGIFALFDQSFVSLIRTCWRWVFSKEYSTVRFYDQAE